LRILPSRNRTSSLLLLGIVTPIEWSTGVLSPPNFPGQYPSSSHFCVLRRTPSDTGVASAFLIRQMPPLELRTLRMLRPDKRSREKTHTTQPRSSRAYRTIAQKRMTYMQNNKCTFNSRRENGNRKVARAGIMRHTTVRSRVKGPDSNGKNSSPPRLPRVHRRPGLR